MYIKLSAFRIPCAQKALHEVTSSSGAALELLEEPRPAAGRCPELLPGRTRGPGVGSARPAAAQLGLLHRFAPPLVLLLEKVVIH